MRYFWVLAAVFCPFATQAQELGGSASGAGSSFSNPDGGDISLVGEWRCEISLDFGSAVSVVSYFPNGDTSVAAIIEVAGTPIVVTVYGVGRWGVEGTVLTETTTTIEVLRMDGLPEGQVPAVRAEFERSLIEDPTVQSEIVSLTRTEASLRDVDTGDLATCTRL